MKIDSIQNGIVLDHITAGKALQVYHDLELDKTIIGFIYLLGIATRNGILLVSHYNHLRSEGMSLHDSVVLGSLDRLNPILMTALTSALALIPLAVGGDLPGNEIQSPMAQVILGGLLSSTLLNGFVVPIMYLLLNHKQKEIENLEM